MEGWRGGGVEGWKGIGGVEKGKRIAQRLFHVKHLFAHTNVSRETFFDSKNNLTPTKKNSEKRGAKRIERTGRESGRRGELREQAAKAGAKPRLHNPPRKAAARNPLKTIRGHGTGICDTFLSRITFVETARASVVPEVRGEAEATRTWVREPSHPREDAVPREAAAAACPLFGRTAEPKPAAAASSAGC